MSVALGLALGIFIGAAAVLGLIVATGKLDSNGAWGFMLEVCGHLWTLSVAGTLAALVLWALSKVF